MDDVHRRVYVRASLDGPVRIVPCRDASAYSRYHPYSTIHRPSVVRVHAHTTTKSHHLYVQLLAVVITTTLSRVENTSAFIL